MWSTDSLEDMMMKALVYHGPGEKAWEEVARPELVADTDAIVQVDTTTICTSSKATCLP
jgi:threonine dehydrogenase-like Zn-dependent dehydrogenase